MIVFKQKPLLHTKRNLNQFYPEISLVINFAGKVKKEVNK